MRRLLYLLARLLGDFSAAGKGRTGKRLIRRGAGKASGKMMGKFFK